VVRLWRFPIAVVLCVLSLALGGADALGKGREGEALTDASEATGTIAVGGEVDEYTFTVQEGDRLVVVGDGAALNDYDDLYLSVYAPSGGRVDDDHADGVFRIVLQAEETGTYRLEAKGQYGDTVGDYTLRFWNLDEEGRAGGWQALSDGETVEDVAIDGHGDIDGHTFDGQAGDRIVLVADGVPLNGGDDLKVEVYTPSGSRLGYGISQYMSSLPLTLTETGIHFVKVTGQYADTVGSYTLWLSNFDEERRAGLWPELHHGDAVLDQSIGFPGDVDGYTFAGLAGDRVTVVGNGIPLLGSDDLRLKVYAPDGTTILNVRSSGYPRATVALPADGTYVIKAEGEYADTVGDYSLWLTNLDEDQRQGGWGELSDGAETTGAELLHPGDMDAYTFDGMAGDVIKLLANGQAFTGSHDLVMRVYGPDGTQVLYKKSSGYVVTDLELGDTGTYLLTVEGEYANTVGTYTLWSHNWQAAVRAEDWSELSNGVSTPGNLDAIGEQDVYFFRAFAGDTVTISGTDSFSSSGSDLHISVYAPDGTLLTDKWGAYGVNIADLAIPVFAPDYRIVVDGESITTGGYTVTLTNPSEPDWPRPAVGTVEPLVLMKGAAAADLDLSTLVSDPDHSFAELQLALLGNTPAGIVTAALGDDGVLQLTPVADIVGTATISLSATDPTGLAVTFDQLVHVVATPVLADGEFDLSEEAGDGQALGTMAVEDDEPDDVFTFAITDGPAGVLAIDSATGALTVLDSWLLDFETQPLLGFTVQVTDRWGLTDAADLTVHILDGNDRPEPVDDTFAIDEDTVLSDDLLANDSDRNAGDTLSVNAGAVVSERGIRVELSSDGAFVYDPQPVGVLQALAPGEELVDTFDYIVQDNHGARGGGQVTITVAGRNDAPHGIALSTDGIARTAGPGTDVGILAISDVDSDAWTLELVAGDGSTDNTAFLVNGSQLELNADASTFGGSTVSVRVRATDGGGLSCESPLQIGVILRVPEDAATLDGALTAVGPGGIIALGDGNFTCSVPVPGGVTIRGNGSDKTSVAGPLVILGGGELSGISSSDVSFVDADLADVVIRDCQISRLLVRGYGARIDATGSTITGGSTAAARLEGDFITLRGGTFQGGNGSEGESYFSETGNYPNLDGSPGGDALLVEGRTLTLLGVAGLQGGAGGGGGVVFGTNYLGQLVLKFIGATGADGEDVRMVPAGSTVNCVGCGPFGDPSVQDYPYLSPRSILPEVQYAGNAVSFSFVPQTTAGAALVSIGWQLGDGSVQPLAADPEGFFSLQFPAPEAAGNYVFHVILSDDAGRESRFTVPVFVELGEPKGVFLGPKLANPGDTVVLEVQATDPNGTVASVAADSVPFGPGSPIALQDDGTGGDMVAGDGVWSATVTLPTDLTVGRYPVALTLTDDGGLASGSTGSILVDPNTILLIDDFESGDLSARPWVAWEDPLNPGGVSVVAQDAPGGGSFQAKLAAPPGDCSLSLTIDLPEAGCLTFLAHFDSYDNWASLTVDGVEAVSWDAMMDPELGGQWQTMCVPGLAAGQHTFTWSVDIDAWGDLPDGVRLRLDDIRLVRLPPEPLDLTTMPGTEGCALTWRSAPGVTRYEIWRGVAENLSDRQRIGEVMEREYTSPDGHGAPYWYLDSTAGPQQYRYTVRAIYGETPSGFSAAVVGGAYTPTVAWQSKDKLATTASGQLVADADRAVVFSGADGALHCYERTGGVWSETQVLPAPEVPLGDGESLAIDGDWMAVGAGQSCYLYHFAEGTWSLQQTLASPLGDDDGGRFGHAVSMQDGRLAVGAPGYDIEGDQNRGAVYLYDLAEGVWEFQEALLSAGEFDGLGSVLCLNGDGLFAGGANSQDSILLFAKAGVWTETTVLAPSPVPDAGYWWSVSDMEVFGGLLAVSTDGRGLFFYAEQPDGTWSSQASEDMQEPRSAFVGPMSVDGQTLVVGLRQVLDYDWRSRHIASIWRLVGGVPTEVSRVSAGAAYANCDAGYALSGSDLLVSVSSGDDKGVWLFSEASPAVVTQPISVSVPVGEDVVFTVECSGAGVLTYQWHVGDTPLAGANSSALSLNDVAWANAGDYQCRVTNAYGDAWSLVATLTVIRQNQTIAFAALPGKTYGDAPFPAGAVSDAGLTVALASSEAGVATVADGAITVVGAGTCVVTASQRGNADFEPAVDVARTLTVAKRSLVVVANDAAFTYGQAVPAFTVSLTGLVPGDTAGDIDVLPTIAAGSVVLDSTLAPSGGADANYAFTQYLAGALTVRPVPLTVRALDVQRRPGHPNPGFESTVTGLINGDAFDDLGMAVSLTCAATEASPVGDYAITPSFQGELQRAYTLIPQSGTLAVRDEPTAVFYVDSQAPADGDGSSWQTAFQSISEAMLHARQDNDVWVAAGTYVETVEVPAYVWVFAGFAGAETVLEARDWRYNRTIISQPVGLRAEVPLAVLREGSVVDGMQILGGLTDVPEGRAELRHCQLRGAPVLLQCAQGLVVENCALAEAQRGIVGTEGTPDVDVRNCLFWDIAQAGISDTDATVYNSSFLNTGGSESPIWTHLGGNTATATNCIFLGGEWAGPIAGGALTNCFLDSNRDFGSDAAFVDCMILDSPGVVSDSPEGPDGILWTLDDGLRLGEGSACIDAGSATAAPAKDCLGRARRDEPTAPNNGSGEMPWTDIGAYEFPGTGDEVALAVGDGWSLVSAPFEVPSFLTSLADATRSPLLASTAWTWNAATLRYAPVAPGGDLAARQGSWIRTTGAGRAAANLPGIRSSVSLPQLVPGWNMVGVSDTVPATALARPGAGRIPSVWCWDTGAQIYVLLDADTKLQRGRGYWVYQQP